MPAVARARTAQPASADGWTVVGGCFQLLRARQWIKNVFVLAPLVFAGKLTDGPSVRTALWAFASFCLLSSSLYIVNDWLDREQDRAHPRKSGRAIACGIVSRNVAWPLAAALFALAMALAYGATNVTVVELELGYTGTSLLYSFVLKNVVLLDVFAIALGFVIRVWVGAFAVSVDASHWIILCTLLLALFLGFSKRKNEIGLLASASARHRPVLVRYSPERLTQMNVIVCAAIIVSYALYTVAPETVAKFGTDRLIYGVPFVVYGLFRYLFLIEQGGVEGDPTELLIRDRPLLAAILLWIGYCAWVVYATKRSI